ncbi:glycoside hydrolase family 13 protein [Microcella pacifica]|uniref:Glycoside hydrolase family 13 protein n=1 Tax=Microcella pacifica TaxID=2591847 RepID=A0A9E5JM69_9MICO|nr:glycoside hydrolase family 13 protein [Microcella pacifica]NHF63218.1 glycoside hydrolase family 13 protein [Microcella pacifica]
MPHENTATATLPSGHPRELASAPGSEWWRSAVIYQIYPRSFADASGDGIGDLAGITQRLESLANLGVDAVWLSPFFRSPQKDAGYDVSDYCDVDPIFGTLDDFDALRDRAHELGLRVIVDLVPNHCSSEHEWFQEAMAAGPGSPERDRFIFRPGTGDNGELPPNNWHSMFGGPAWTRTTNADGTPGDWYLHLFDSTQPDFDWTNPWVWEQFRQILRFWLDRGADGFRVDVAHGLMKAEGLPDIEEAAEEDSELAEGLMGSLEVPYWGQDTVHAVYRDWHAVLAEYEGDRVLCAEAWVEPLAKAALWVRPDEMHQAFNFSYLATPWLAPRLRDVITESLEAFTGVGAPSTWVLSNHDVVRHASRLGLAPYAAGPGAGIGPSSPEKPDAALGLHRARAATALMLALPGSAYLYQGEELGLPEVIELDDEYRQDPSFHRTGGEVYGRDGCRVPIPWEPDAPAFGFNTTGESWLPQPETFARFAHAAQADVEGSTLELYRLALALRAEHGFGLGTLTWLEGYADEVLAFRNGGVTVIANLGDAPVELPAGEVILASDPLEAGAVPSDTTVWVAA